MAAPSATDESFVGRASSALPVWVWVCSVVWAVSFGASYGAGNQVSYLIHGVHLANPVFLQYDWLTAHTTDYHPVFSRLVAMLSAAGILKQAAIVLNVAFATAAGLILYEIVGMITSAHNRTAVFLLVLSLSALDRTRTVADSYLLSNELQPSTVAAVALVAASWLFVRGRYLASGVTLMIGGAFHANYLVLCPALFGLAMLMDGRKSLVKRGVQTLAPSAAVIILFLPLLLTASGGGDARAARTILQEIRAPQHYALAGFSFGIPPFFAWGVLGLLSLAAARRREQRAGLRPLAALFLATTSLIVVASVQAVVGPIPILTQLYLWRLAPMGVLLAQILLAQSLAVGPSLSMVMERSRQGLLETALGICAFLLIIRDSRYYGNLAAAVCLTIIAAAYALPRLSMRRVSETALAVLVFSTAVVWQGYGALRTNTLVGWAPKDERQLYAWASRTVADAQFLVPLDLSGFRLHAGRAIVVDWKTPPFMPSELVEWYRRVGRMAGDSGFRSYAAAVHGYAAMTADRMAALVRDYGVTYVVAQKEWSWPPLPGYSVAFTNSKFVVLEVPPPLRSFPKP